MLKWLHLAQAPDELVLEVVSISSGRVDALDNLIHSSSNIL